MRVELLVLVIMIVLLGCKSPTLPVEVIRSSVFNNEECNLIENGDSLTPFRILTITSLKDSLLLREVSKDVLFNESDSLLALFSKRLEATVRDSNALGVGIAAPQVGILKNIICVQRFDKKDNPFEIYYNPRIKQYSKKTQPCREGCLSIPGRMDTLEVRSYAILLDYDDIKGKHQYELIEDFTAVIFQHEIDHLKGVLYTDYLHEKAHAEGIKHSDYQ